MRRLFTLLFLVPILAAPSFADDEQKGPTFPEPGSSIPGPYHVRNITGPRKGYYHCLVCRNGLNPVAAVLVEPQKPDGAKEDWLADWVKDNLADDAPLCKLFKKLSTVSEKNPDAFLGVYAIFFANKAEEDPLLIRLAKLPEALDTKNIIYAVGSPDEPKSRVEKNKEIVNQSWFEKKEFETGVLLYERYKVLSWQPFAAGKLTDKDIAKIVKEFDDLVPPTARPGYRPKLKLPKQ
jgi:hypothetical protein